MAKKKKKDDCAKFYCVNESLLCIHRLFEGKHVTAMSKGYDRNRQPEFHLWKWVRRQKFGPEGEGWKLHGTDEILEAIKLADKHKIEKVQL